MGRIILHVGLDKTGTSSIQKFLTRNRVKLKKMDVLYPETDHNAHHHMSFARSFGFSPMGQFDEDLATRAFEQTINWSGTTVISSEHFSYITKTDPISGLAKKLEAKDVEVVIYLRNQVSWASSLYNEAIKWGYDKEYPVFIKERMGRFDFDRFVGKWENYFGKIVVKNYDNDAENLIKNFLDTVDKGVAEQFEGDMLGSNSNVSPCNKVLDIQRFMNANLEKEEARQHYQKMQSALKAVGFDFDARGKSIRRFPIEHYARLLDWDKSNKRLRERYGILDFAEAGLVKIATDNETVNDCDDTHIVNALLAVLMTRTQ